MTRKRYKNTKPKVSNPNSRYRKLMRYVEPKVFYEDNYFSPDAPDADTWRECWIAEKVMLGLLALQPISTSGGCCPSYSSLSQWPGPGAEPSTRKQVLTRASR